MWGVLVRGLPLGLALKGHGLATYNCFVCTIQVDDGTPHFIQYPFACQIWGYISHIDKFCRHDSLCSHNSHRLT